ncbi:MAG: DUF1289 domain-containing protein [Methylocella sp.]
MLQRTRLRERHGDERIDWHKSDYPARAGEFAGAPTHFASIFRLRHAAHGHPPRWRLWLHLAGDEVSVLIRSQASAERMNIQTKSIPSPCTGICTMDGALGFCLGCGRTGDEIAEWPSAGDVRRSAIWAVLPERIDALGISITRLPWSHGRIAEFVAESLGRKSGTWALGCYGATAEFICRHDEPCDVSVTGETITAISGRGALQLTIGEQVRALRLRADHTRHSNWAIFLVVLKARATLPVATTLTPLGRDKGAIHPECRNDTWFDLGLGRGDLRFCVRAATTELRDKLNQASGLPLSDVLQAAGATIVKHSPARVVESTLGRAEIYTPIPLPGGQSPDGPHTHLLPDHLASGLATPPGIDLPPVYALGATFYHRAASSGDIEPGCAA